jgi:Flp pilus assembly protein TadD
MHIFQRNGAEHTAARMTARRTGVALVLLLASCSLSGNQPVGFQSQVAVAEQMLQNGQLERGYRILDDVSQQHGSSGPAQLALGNAYLNGAAFLKADIAYRRAIEAGRAEEGRIGLGRVALAQNKAALARQHFKSVLDRNPRSLPARNGLGVSHDLDRDHHLAIAEYRKALELDPANATALNNLGLSLALAGSAAEATGILSDLAGSNLSDPVIRQNLAIAYMVTGREQDAYRLATTDISDDRARALRDAVIRYRRARS